MMKDMLSCRPAHPAFRVSLDYLARPDRMPCRARTVRMVLLARPDRMVRPVQRAHKVSQERQPIRVMPVCLAGMAKTARIHSFLARRVCRAYRVTLVRQ